MNEKNSRIGKLELKNRKDDIKQKDHKINEKGKRNK